MNYTIKKSVVQHGLPWDVSIYSGTSAHGLESKYEELPGHRAVDVELVRALLDEALRRLDSGDLERTTTLDQWLSPRMHSAVRIPRRLAGDMGFWRWMVLEVGRPYTWRRWRESGDRVTPYRYIGDFKRNALARLWWFAEMTRNGPSYAPIVDVLRDASTAQYSLELRYSMYRPAVIAFGRVAQAHELDFAQLKGLSKRINAYLSLRALEELGFSEDRGTRDAEWWNYQPQLGELVVEGDLVGPRDAFADESAIAELAGWFESLLSEQAAAA